MWGKGTFRSSMWEGQAKEWLNFLFTAQSLYMKNKLGLSWATPEFSVELVSRGFSRSMLGLKVLHRTVGLSDGK